MFVEVKNLWKKYSENWILKDLSLEIERGKILGVLGANGAGKSTLFRILANVTKATHGEVKIKGFPVGRKTRSLVSYLPDTDPYYSRMRVVELLRFLSTFYPNWEMEKSKELSSLLKVSLDERVGALSRGQKARLKMIASFSWPGELILLDEPLGGIDPISRKKIIEALFNEFRFGEQTILIATHLVSEVEEFLEDVVYIDDGKIILSGNTDELRGQYNKSLTDIFEEVL